MYKLNDKIKGLTPYNPLSERYKIRLDANESCFNLSEDIMKEIHSAIDKIDYNRYPDPNCTNLAKAFAKYYNINSDYVTVGNGSDELISVILTSFMMKGQSIVTIEPDFSMYRFYASLSELNYIVVNKDEELRIDINNVIKTIKDNCASAVIFSNPCNPTSKGLNKDDIVKLITSVDALVILDEAYMDFWDCSFLNDVGKYDNLIILRTASKACGAASLRLGFAISNPEISYAIKAVKSPYNVNTISQKIGEIIYNNHSFLENNKKTIVSLRLSLYNDIKDIEKKYNNDFYVLESDANFIFIKTKYAKRIYDYMIIKSLAIRLMGNFIRVTAGTDEENKIFITYLNEFFDSLNN